MFDDRYTLAAKVYPYEKSPDQDLDAPVRHPVVVMGGGPIESLIRMVTQKNCAKMKM